MNGFNWLKFTLFLFFLLLFSVGVAIRYNGHGLGILWFGAGGIVYLIATNMFNYLNNNQ